MTQPNFNERVYLIVKKIPRGRVASYGQIAAMLGSPRAARIVGWALHQLDRLPPEKFKHYPWWRVVNSRGYISTTCQEHTFEMQKINLEKEGVKVIWDKQKKMYRLDLNKYLWQPKLV